MFKIFKMFKKDKNKPIKEKELKPKTKRQEDKEYKKRARGMSDMIKLIPIIDYDLETDAFITNDGKYIDFLQVLAKDLSNIGEDAVNYDIASFDKLYKIYKSDFKIVVLNYPVNTTKQIEYFESRIGKTTNPVFLNYLNEKIAELKYLENKRYNREFYLMLFSTSRDEHFKNLNMMKGTLESLAMDIDMEKKIHILEKLANKNIQVK